MGYSVISTEEDEVKMATPGTQGSWLAAFLNVNNIAEVDKYCKLLLA